MSKSGLILIVLGCLFLANNFGLLEWGWLRQWWPLALIAVGIWSIVDQRRRPGDRSSSRGGEPKP